MQVTLPSKTQERENGSIVLVTHTFSEEKGEGVIQIISARTATPFERRQCE